MLLAVGRGFSDIAKAWRSRGKAGPMLHIDAVQYRTLPYYAHRPVSEPSYVMGLPQNLQVRRTLPPRSAHLPDSNTVPEQEIMLCQSLNPSLVCGERSSSFAALKL